MSLPESGLSSRGPVVPLGDQFYSLAGNWGWFMALGISYVILGAFAFSWPVASTVALTFVLGTLFIVTGVLQGVHAIQLRRHVGAGWRLLHSVVALGAGFLMLRHPSAGMIGVAFAMAFFFLVSAVSKWALASLIRPHKGWGWLFVSALASLFLSLYIIATFPASALWVPGAILGIDLVITGLSLSTFSLDLRSFHKRHKEIAEAQTPKIAA